MAFGLGRYFWKLFIVNAALMALLLAASVWVILAQVDRFHHEETSRHLRSQAAALEVAVRDRFDPASADALDALAKEVGSTESEGVRVTFVLTDGTVLGDSEAHPAEMESHADRPEIRQALTGEFGESTRWSHTVSKNMTYVAARIGPAENPRGVVRVAMARQRITERAKPAQRLIMTIAMVTVAAAVLLALALALLWSRRLRRITETAQNIARGDLDARVDVLGHDEVALLARSLNRMRSRLSTQLNTIDRHRRTLESILSQLREGVVVADANGRIVLINNEAMTLLGLAEQNQDQSLVGTVVEQCVPQKALQEMLFPSKARTVTAEGVTKGAAEAGLADSADAPTLEKELELSATGETRHVLARAFGVRLPELPEPSPTSRTTRTGRVLVLTDITDYTNVMQVKADLAANASHELRTPLSAIRAAVDTLRSLDLQHDSQTAAEFIHVLDRHSTRMQDMITDLLDLSRLESRKHPFEEATVYARSLLDDLHASFKDALAAKTLHWHASIAEPDTSFAASRELLGMTLRNLVDNAIRFTESGGEIRLTVTRDEQEVRIEVADTGCGIPHEHQQRVFERFYQVERARSGPNRGTGLGLSIVRHAAAAMNASIELHSTPRQGTRITIFIPALA